MSVRPKIYVASSWRNAYYDLVCKVLNENGYECLDWREPTHAFKWEQIGLSIMSQTEGTAFTADYIDRVTNTERAKEAFVADFMKMQDADACVLLLPCGRSAHFEAGWFWGKRKPIYVLLIENECTPELMYLGASGIYQTINGLLDGMQMNMQLAERTVL